MRFTLSAIILYSFCIYATAQGISKSDWYSQTNTNGIVMQNSLPKGGPYPGPVKKNFNYTQLVFFTRVVNETGTPFELTINFSADSIPIPGAPLTFVKLFLPPDTMTHDKKLLFNYGVTDLEFFDQPTSFQKTLAPDEEILFYVVSIFYQTSPTAPNHQRGGNRAELILKGDKLFYSMLPQIDLLPCGRIISKR